MRNMSFSMTEAAILDHSKTVTRRLGWLTLKPGTRLKAVHKSMGLKRGEKPRVLGIIEVVDVRREPLWPVDDADAAAEGYPDLTGEEFVQKFMDGMRCDAETVVTRIEFRYVDE